jgi:hypothetical protein
MSNMILAVVVGRPLPWLHIMYIIDPVYHHLSTMLLSNVRSCDHHLPSCFIILAHKLA